MRVTAYKVVLKRGTKPVGVLGPYIGPNAKQSATEDAREIQTDPFWKQSGTTATVIATRANPGSRRQNDMPNGITDRLEAIAALNRAVAYLAEPEFSRTHAGGVIREMKSALEFLGIDSVSQDSSGPKMAKELEMRFGRRK